MLIHFFLQVETCKLNVSQFRCRVKQCLYLAETKSSKYMLLKMSSVLIKSHSTEIRIIISKFLHTWRNQKN